MTEIGESVALQIVPEDHDPDTCCFCHQEEPEERENHAEEVDDNDTPAQRDEIAWVKFKNDAGTLAKNLGKADTGDQQVGVLGRKFDIGVAAHHVIPGNAALKNSELFTSSDYVWQDGKKNGNIGYDVNRGANGVWLPGNYAIRPWGPQGAVFAKKMDKKDAPEMYAHEVISTTGRQFHDAHEHYSQIVLDALNKLHEKLGALRGQCPQVEPKGPVTKALPMIVGYLDRISVRMRAMLTRPTTKWKPEVYTSRFSQSWMAQNLGRGTKRKRS